jgi:predicted transcriptional regulator
MRLPVIVREMDDAHFLAWAIRGNQGHGKRMTPEEVQRQVAKLATLGWKQTDIANETGISQSAVSRMLSGADSNASRKRTDDLFAAGSMRTHTSSDESMRTNNQPDSDQADDQPVSERERTQVGVRLARVHAAALDELRPLAVRACLATLNEDERARVMQHLEAVIPAPTAEQRAQREADAQRIEAWLDAQTKRRSAGHSPH